MDMDRDIFFAPEVEFAAVEAPIYRRHSGTRQWLCAGLVAAAAVVTTSASILPPTAEMSIQGTVPVRTRALVTDGWTRTPASVPTRTTELTEHFNRSVRSLAVLAPGWDGAGAPAISGDVVMYGLKTLTGMRVPKKAPPSVVPTTGGGLQFEWHTQTHHVELEFEKLGKFSLYVERRGADEDPYFSEFDGDISEAREVLNRALRA